MSVTLIARDLRRGFRAVRHAIGGDLTRPVLTTVLFSAVDGHLYLFAADNFRIARYELPITGDPSDFDQRATFIRDEDVAMLRASMPHGDAVITLSVGSGRLVVEWAEGRLTPAIPPWMPWPGYEAVIRAAAQPTPNVLLSPHFIYEAAEAARNIGATSLRIAIGEWDSPVRIEAGPLTEWVMPIRGEAQEQSEVEAPR